MILIDPKERGGKGPDAGRVGEAETTERESKNLLGLGGEEPERKTEGQLSLVDQVISNSPTLYSPLY